MGHDPIWLGILLAINLQTSFLTPPFGFSLFYLRGRRPARDQHRTDLQAGVIPFIGLQLLGMTLVWLVSEVVRLADGTGGHRDDQIHYCPEHGLLTRLAFSAAAP
jgi:TRAP-type mannitol/chloroaromatic compound transport system permease large subunit